MSTFTHFTSIISALTSSWMIALASVVGVPTDPGAPVAIYLPIVASQNATNDTAAAAITAPTVGMWLSAAEIASLPMAGPAWDLLKASADQSTGAATLGDQDSNVNLRVLAKALVYARTGQATYRSDVAAAIQVITLNNTESGGRTLALGRELAAYVIAADLIDLANYDPSLDAKFRVKLRELLTKQLDGLTLVGTQEIRPNNWGTHAGASRTAVAIYLGDRAELDRAAKVFQGWLGNRAAYAGFSYGDTSWQADPSKPVGVNPQGATKEGHSIDGALPDDMRRGAPFQWPPASTGYPWEALQGAVVQAELLERAGYPAWDWENRALLRAVQFLYSINWPAQSDDTWQLWLINQAYGTNYATTIKNSLGKNMSWTSWTHATSSAPATNQAPTVNAGVDASIPLPNTATLDGTVNDDGRPNNRVTTTWSKASGPGTVTFANASAVDTTATFSQVGTYILRLTASDGALSTSDDVQLTVTAATTNQAPTVNAGADTTIALASTANLDGTASDDGQPSNSLTATWSKVSGPGTVTFANANTVDTTATFSAAGVYVLRLTLSDGALTSTDDVQITVNAAPTPTPPPTLTPIPPTPTPPPTPPANQAPTVNAGSDQTIATTASATLDGTVADDGLPNPPAAVSATWSKVSGPGNVTFGNANAVDTTATFSAAGSYVLRLSVTDGALTSTDDLTVVVTAPSANLTFAPVADAHVKSTSATSNYGTTRELQLRGSNDPVYNSYLRFTVSGVANAVQSAKLRLFVTDASKVGGSVYSVSNNFTGGSTAWTETGLTWSNAPAIAGNPLSTLATTTANSWVEFDVTAAVTGNGTYSFGLLTNSSDSAIYSSKEGGNPPQLVLVLNSGAPPTQPTNQAPTVNAGTDATITFPAIANLDGTVSDDGKPTNALATTWSKVSGPGTVTFGNANTVDTTATFSVAGVYVLRLTANDGALSTSDDLQLTVNSAAATNQAPTVNAGADATIVLPTSANLDGTASDDGQPSNTVTTTWSKVSGPGNVAFGNAAAIDTSATFSAAGVYVLRLTASDGALSASDDLQIIVNQSAATTLTVVQTADAHVTTSSPARNYGADKTFRMRSGDPTYSSYLQFTVSGLSAAPQSAKLRLYVTDESNVGGSLYLVANTLANSSNPWTESTITWANAPAMSGTPVSTLGAVQRNSWVEFDVTAAIRGDGTYSFGLLTNSTNSVIFSSREGTNKPSLVLTTADGLTTLSTMDPNTIDRITTAPDESEITEPTDEELEQEWQSNNANRIYLPFVQNP